MGSPGIINNRTLDNATKFPVHGCIDDLTTEHSFHLQATWIIDVLNLFSDMLFIGALIYNQALAGSCQIYL